MAETPKPRRPNDPHPETEETGRDRNAGRPGAPKDREALEIEETNRVNNGTHDGERYTDR